MMQDAGNKAACADVLEHSFGPLYSERSQVLILGSFPSVKSREQNFFYGHPQNRFWRVIAAITGQPVPETTPGAQGPDRYTADRIFL